MRYFQVAIVWFVLLTPVVGAAIAGLSAWRSRGLNRRSRLTMALRDLVIILTVLGIAAVTLIPQGGLQTGLAAGGADRALRSIL